MKQRNLASLLLAGAMTAALLTGPAQAAESPSPQEIAATRLQAEGLMNGDEHGDLHLDKGLTRAELACLISPIVLNPEHVAWETRLLRQAVYHQLHRCTGVGAGGGGRVRLHGYNGRIRRRPVWPLTTRSARKWPARSCSDTWNETAGLTLPPAARRWNWDLPRRRRWRERPSPVETWPSC